jgi:hypothetical protein
LLKNPLNQFLLAPLKAFIFNFSILFDFSREIKKIKSLCIEGFKKSKKIKKFKGFNMEGIPLPL